MIMIRADANQSIATGHLMRTLAIAEECAARNMTVCFVLADEESLNILKNLCPEWKSFSVVILHGVYCRPEEELPAMKELLKKEKPYALLIDSYFVTVRYLTELRKFTRIVYLDDIRAFDYPVDTVVNYDVIPQKNLSVYGNAYLKSGKQLLGPEYAPLRKQFKAVPYQVREKVTDVLITTGGTDEGNMTGKMLETVLGILEESVRVHVIVGALNRHKKWLKKKAGEQKRITLYEGVRDMAGLMSQCDLALSAAGTTLYELCAIGVPTVCFTIAENQVFCAEGFASYDAVIYHKGSPFGGYKECGRLEEHGGHGEYGEYGEQIKRLADDYPLRRRQSEIMRSLVDGKGSARIADELEK